MTGAATQATATNDVEREVRAWLAANWDADKRCEKGTDKLDAKGWLTRVRDAGYAVPTWSPEWFGRDFSSAEARLVDKAFREVRAPGTGQDRSNLGAVTVYKQGSDELKAAHLPGMLLGMRGCLLYSEPSAGSDLAGVRTRAERNGDEFVVNGQKIWTSSAREADYGMLLARTDWDVPKHSGLTFFILPMRQPGVEIRPLNQITGESEFNEVFLTDARVPAANIVGREHGGWQVLQTALAYERLIMGEGASQRGGTKVSRVPEVIAVARKTGRIGDPAMRQRIAQQLAWRQLNELNMRRAKEEIRAQGSSSLMSLGKLAMSRIQHGEARLRSEMLGAEGLLDDAAHPEARDANFDSAKAYMNSIGGGTDQIQRNIISERILGLPREQEADRTIPFRDVKSG
ncbi:MAG: acyl-CoA dehydrogenase family protein [Novosphingobium sp.]|nr:acyl-CoA dehydrogenase family protein [Novosphingobium sp.]